MKRMLALLLTLTLALGLLAGCGTTVVVAVPAPTPEAETPTPSPETPPAAVPGGVPVKTGLALLTSVSSSKDATADADGLAQADITVVAVTVGDDGIIYDCVIDSIQSKLNFATSGALLSDLTLTIPSKNELGADYGMGKISSIGREWNEQAQSLADYVVGKTIPEVKGISISEEGKPTGADLTASVTMSIGGYISAIEQAAANASHLGASNGDRLVLTTTTNAAKSTDATSDADGLAQAYATVGALTLSGDTITSMVIDAVQANVNFNAAGTNTTAAILQKKAARSFFISSSFGFVLLLFSYKNMHAGAGLSHQRVQIPGLQVPLETHIDGHTQQLGASVDQLVDLSGGHIHLLRRTAQHPTADHRGNTQCHHRHAQHPGTDLPPMIAHSGAGGNACI